MQTRKYKILISGGGTGGHIFPAIAIANALKRKLQNPDILFVGAKGRMEMDKVPAAGYPIKGLWISGLQRKLSLKNLAFPFKLISSLIKAGTIIRKFKPDVVIGVGGYASGPTLRVAAMKKIPCLIQEQNSFPGITNRLLALKVNTICTAYDLMDRFFPSSKIVKTGNPIRQDVIKTDGKREEAAKFFGLTAEKTTIFIVGGSQGARAINHAIEKILPEFVKRDIQLLWQTGTSYLHTANESINKLKHDNLIKAVDFINKMDLAYAMADIVISRAGAIAISELCAVRKAVIFIPLPSAAENHQLKNAEALVEKKAALLIPENEISLRLLSTLFNLINNKEQQKLLSENIAKMATLDADEKIAGEIIKLISK